MKYRDARVNMADEILAGIHVIQFYFWEKPVTSSTIQHIRTLINLGSNGNIVRYMISNSFLFRRALERDTIHILDRTRSGDIEPLRYHIFIRTLVSPFGEWTGSNLHGTGGEYGVKLYLAVVFRNILSCQRCLPMLFKVLIPCMRLSHHQRHLLLFAILHEMEALDNGQVYIPTKVNVSRKNLVSYCSQSLWVVNGTLKGNILFRSSYDEARHNEVVKACALVDDLAILPAGDMTEIGECGINFRGQKTQVSLARAMYSEETQVMLLDDPLSAVDAHLRRTSVQGGYHWCDAVIMLDSARITHYVKYADLIAKGVDFKGAVEAKRDETNEKPATEYAKVATPEESKVKKAGEKVISDEKKEE
eukprot:scaffold149431_cov36-Cyclotella_meneghiniana.AAC.2